MMTLTVFPLDGGSFDNTPHATSSGAVVLPSYMLVICLVATAVASTGAGERVLYQVLELIGGNHGESFTFALFLFLSFLNLMEFRGFFAFQMCGC